MNDSRNREVVDQSLRYPFCGRISCIEVGLVHAREMGDLVRQIQQPLPTLVKTIQVMTERQAGFTLELTAVTQITEDLRRIAPAHEDRIEFIRREVNRPGAGPANDWYRGTEPHPQPSENPQCDYWRTAIERRVWSRSVLGLRQRWRRRAPQFRRDSRWQKRSPCRRVRHRDLFRASS